MLPGVLGTVGAGGILSGNIDLPSASGRQTTTQQFDPYRQQLLEQIFGPGGGGLAGPGFNSLFGGFGLQNQKLYGPLQRQAVNQLSQFLDQESPEAQAFRLAQGGLLPILQGEGQFGNIEEAARPVFERSLTEGLSQLGAQAPGRFGSAFLQQGTDLSGRAIQDFNLFIEQGRQQDIQNQLQAALALGTLGQGAGGAQNRALQIGQFALSPDFIGSQQRLQAQLAILGLLQQPTGTTTTQTPGLFDYFSGIAGLGGLFAGGGLGGS